MVSRANNFLSIIYWLICVAIIESGWHTIYAGKCPSSRVLFPCNCHLNSITCGDKQKYGLKRIFLDLSNNLAINDKHFRDFIFENPSIEEFDENLFHSITFKNITIRGANSLIKIKSNAFNNTAKSVQIFDQRGDSKLDNKYINQFFDALSSLVNVKEIIIELNYMKSFPSQAFRNINGKQTKLETITIYSKSITKISNYAFYELPNLRHVKIVAQNLSWISAHSFDFEMPSNHILNIDLQSSKLNAKSFEIDSFLDTKRPINLMLMHNKIYYLNETIFAPILNSDTRNVINLAGNALQCNCQMFWIISDKDSIKHQIINAVCNDLINIWSIDESHFNGCRLDNNYAPKLVIKSLSFKTNSSQLFLLCLLFLLQYLIVNV